ncbi:MAG: hypothetical protein KDD53_03705 [Bdellovibrionales bacterium]|nr:hypothetical protein [Bdellovibrionales bacterium]
MDFRGLAKTLGGLCIVLGVVLTAPGIYSLIAGGLHTQVFFIVALSAIVTGSLLWISQAGYQKDINIRTGFAVVTLSWVLAAVLGAMPFYLSGSLSTFVDAFFESASGFSGTGASAINDIESLDSAIVLWRSMTQWLGGMGIIVFFIAILPALGLGGVQLFKAEITGPQGDKLTPRVREAAKKLWLLYLGFTVLLALLLWAIGGMSLFDAINHSFTTCATGGYSTKNSGVAWFASPTVDIILIVFMSLCSINFNLHYRLLLMKDVSIFRDTEMKWYLWILGAMTLIVTLINWGPTYNSFFESLRYSAFVVTSTASSTGFSNPDYMLWPLATHFIIVLLMVMGGSSGSTAGGTKVIRLVAALKLLEREFKQIVHPNAVIPVKINNHTVPRNIIRTIWALLFVYFLVFSIAAFLIVCTGQDIVTSSTAVFSALSNIGPALGNLGPTATYSGLSDFAKLVLCVCMILGRLEFFTVLVIFTPGFWKK